MKLKLMNMAAMAFSALLCLTTTGAWAGQETPLITIESTGDNASFTSGSKTFDNKATVTFSGNVGNDNDNWGWYTYSTSEITLTVTAAEGYTITGVKFYNNSGSAFVDEAPFQAILVYDGGVVTKVNGTSIGQLGVTKIEVYGYAGTPATVAVTGVTLNQNEAAMTVGGETLTLTATVNPEGATDKSVSWSTSDGNVATVDNGVVTAVAAGTATITVTTTDGAKTATCTVTVAAPEPAQPEWVLEGDEWDDATKTLTVNSNLPEDAYKGQTVIEHVIISSGVTSVGNSAFYDCSSLTSVTIGNSVTSIGDYAFDSCSGLTSITIPSSVTSIGSDAFYDCTSITDVYCYPNAANLTWDEEEDDFIRNPAKATACHVHADQLSAYESKFTGEVNVTFVGDLPASTPEPEEPEIVNHVQIGDLYYNLNADNQTAEVTYQEFMSETNYSSLTAVNIPESVEYNSVTYSVTSIGMGAFLGCTGLTSITIPSSVTSIGDGAFQSCEGLTSIEIPNSVTSIGGAAFYGCIGLTSVTIGNSVTSIGDAAFCYCTGLASFTINATTQPTLGSAAFEGTAEGLKIYVPAESVADYKAAENWADYEDKIEAIPAPEPSGPHGECGAQGNNVVWSLNTATGVLTISGTGAMADYESVEEQPWKDYRSTITSVVVEEGVTTIGTTAFDGCSGLTSVTIPNSVTSIGGGAFYGCTGLTSVAIPNSVTSIGVGAFEECTGLTSVTIPNSVTSIGNRAFSYCSGLTSIIIPNSVTIIGEDVFNGCSGLTSIEIPNSVTSIGWCAFFGCEGLTSITIPNSVEYIGEGAFFGCTNITDVYCYPSAADLTWNEEDCNDFKDDGSTECHVLANQLAAYQEKFTGVVNVTFVGDLPAPAPAWLLDGDEWDEATKTLTVNSDLPENAYKGQTVIEHVIISSGVTSVGNSAFDGCSGLTSIEIPNGVTSIGYATFAGCTGLTSITIPNSVTSIGDAAFYGCSGLTSITIPNSVTSIGNLAFRYCSNLETVTINAESLESYGTNAFQGTAEGLKIYVPAGSVATYKAAWAAYEDKIVAIPAPAPAWLLDGDEWDDATKTLTVKSNPGSSAYSNVSDIENLVISDAVTSIGEKAFFGCEGLTSVTIGNSVTSIGEAVFVLCTGLTNMVVASGNTTYDSRENCNAIIETSSNTLIAGCKSTIIPSSVTSIGEYAFENCTGLTSITIPNSVTSIGQSAFSTCSGLTSVTIGNSVTNIGAGAFMECKGLTSVTLGNSVESIGEWAFLQCTSLTSITIPNSVTSIGDQAFAGCTGLTSIEIPNSSIGMAAFYGCGLTSVTIGNSVTSIGMGAFYECSGLEKVTILAESLESYGSVAFEGTAEGLKIYVPAGSVDTYKAAENWSAYADKIEAITTVTYETWAEENSITGAWNEKSGGIYNVFRYVFDKPTGVFPLITGIDVGESKVVITTSAVVNSNGVTVSVVESSDLAGKTVTATEALEPEGRAEFTKDPAAEFRFYRLKAEVTIAAPAATVTTAQTAKTGVKAGQNEAIVNAGTAEGGTMMYAVTTDNTQPASTDGFSATVPTAEGLTAGTYYVWCYVKADDSHTDSEISATGIEVTIAAAANIVDLSKLTANYEAQDGDVLTRSTSTYSVTIAAGATVTLDGATISGGSYCIKCAGSATIILKDGTTNTLTSTSQDYPALWAGDANTTLTIQGSTGVLNVTSGKYCAGIGGGYMNTNMTCGNITIEGGVITAQGGGLAPGIGSDSGGNIKCGNITITSGVTRVTATGGEDATYSIGKGNSTGSGASCGTITIGGTVYPDGVTTSPFTYEPAAE